MLCKTPCKRPGPWVSVGSDPILTKKRQTALCGLSLLAHLHKLDTMNRFFVNLFILRVWRMQETYALEEVRDKTDKRDVA